MYVELFVFLVVFFLEEEGIVCFVLWDLFLVGWCKEELWWFVLLCLLLKIRFIFMCWIGSWVCGYCLNFFLVMGIMVMWLNVNVWCRRWCWLRRVVCNMCVFGVFMVCFLFCCVCKIRLVNVFILSIYLRILFVWVLWVKVIGWFVFNGLMGWRKVRCISVLRCVCWKVLMLIWCFWIVSWKFGLLVLMVCVGVSLMCRVFGMVNRWCLRYSCWLFFCMLLCSGCCFMCMRVCVCCGFFRILILVIFGLLKMIFFIWIIVMVFGWLRKWLFFLKLVDGLFWNVCGLCWCLWVRWLRIG